MTDCFPINFMKLVDDDIIMKFLNVKTLSGNLEWYTGNNDYSHGGFAKKGLGYVLPKIENVDFKVLKQDESKLNLASDNIDSVNIKWENNQLVWNYNNENILELEICDESLKSQLKLDTNNKKTVEEEEEKQEKNAVSSALMKLDRPVSKEPEPEPTTSSDIEKMESEFNKESKVAEEKKKVNNKLKNIKTELEDKNKDLEAAAKAKLFNKPPEEEKPDVDVKVDAEPEKEPEEEVKVEGNKEVQKAGRKKRKSKRRNNKRNKRKSKRKKRLLI